MTPRADNSKLQVRWGRYLWLGKVEESDVHLLTDGTRLIKTRLRGASRTEEGRGSVGISR